ncbi:RNA-directed DNA polymerase, eukaryota, reverse transcriptase zinc-binding domain protein [Tanacetum coccineum]
MGFRVKWRSWIHSYLNLAYASVLINGSLTKEFKLDRGLRQGDPLSPFLFIIAVEALNVALLESTNNNIFHGIKFTTSQPSKLEKKLFASLKVFKGIFLGVESANEKKISWIAWDKVTFPPKNGRGLGIGSLKVSNQSLLAKWWWRIRNEEHALWSKVICSLHGPMGGLVEDLGSVIATTGPWSQIRKLKIHLNIIGINLPLLFKMKVGNGRNTSFWHDKWLGGSPLHVTYLRLYRLDLNPHCSVSNRNTSVPQVSSSEVSESSLVRVPSFGRRSRTTGPIINWSWSRPIRSGHESSELAELMSLLTHFNLSDEQDSWEFIIDPSRRIPTIINLDMRGIDLDTLRCPVCDNDLESEDHIFAKCCIAVDTWRDVLLWWHIPGITITSLEDVIVSLSNQNFIITLLW